MSSLLLNETSNSSRDLILSVALDLFTNYGFDGTSIDDIRAAAGFKSKASLYTHFKSKEEVASALLTRLVGHEEEVLIAAYENSHGDALQRFVAMSRTFIEWGLTHPREYVFCFIQTQQEKLVQGQYGYLSGQRTTPSYGILSNLIQEIRQDYPVRAIADAALLSMMVGVVSKAIIDQDSFGALDLSTKVAQILELIMGMFFAQPVAIPE